MNDVYWDTSCFICFLNRNETSRRLICEDVLRHARTGIFTIWTSTWTIVEVIRPKRHGVSPLPEWAVKAIKAVPEGKIELERLWQRYQSSDPAIKLSPTQIAMIEGMFDCPFIKKINLDERVAKAVELARDYGLKPADSVHAASAILKKVAIQRWDRDFDRVKHLIGVDEPRSISLQGEIADFRRIGPAPEDFDGLPLKEGEADEQAVSKENHQREANSADPPAVQGSDAGRAKGETAGETKEGK